MRTTSILLTFAILITPSLMAEEISKVLLSKAQAMYSAGHLSDDDFQYLKLKALTEENTNSRPVRHRVERSIASVIRSSKVIEMVNDPIEVTIQDD